MNLDPYSLSQVEEAFITVGGEAPTAASVPFPLSIETLSKGGRASALDTPLHRGIVRNSRSRNFRDPPEDKSQDTQLEDWVQPPALEEQN